MRTLVAGVVLLARYDLATDSAWDAPLRGKIHAILILLLEGLIISA